MMAEPHEISGLRKMPGNYDGNLNTKEPLWEFQMCTSRERAFLFSTTTFLGPRKGL